MKVFYALLVFFLVIASSQERYNRASDSSEIVSSLNSSYEGEPLLRSYPESEDYYFQNNFDQSAPQLSQEVEVSLRSEPYSPCQDGSFLPYPGDYTRYKQCSCGQCQTYNCAPGLHWNANRNICDWPQSPWTSPTDKCSTSGMTVAPVYDGTGYKVICHITRKAGNRPADGKYLPSDIDDTLCTHINFGFAMLDPNSLTLKLDHFWTDEEFCKKIKDLQAKGIKVIISIGDWKDSEGDKYSRLANNPSSRENFITNVIQIIAKYNFDGLNLNWQYPKCWQNDCNKGPNSDKQAFTALVRELSAAFKPKCLLLSASLSPNKFVMDPAYEVPQLSEYLDWINVLTHVLNGYWVGRAEHIAPLYAAPDSYYSVYASLKYWIKLGANPQKIIMTIPFLGNTFWLKDPYNNLFGSPIIGCGTRGEFTQLPGFIAYYEICNRIKKQGWTTVRNILGNNGPYAYKVNEWNSYDDAAMIVRKSKLIKEFNMGGAMVHALDYDDFKNRCGCGKYPLLKTLYQELRGNENDINCTNCTCNQCLI